MTMTCRKHARLRNLCLALQLPRHEVEALIRSGVIPPGGKFGWQLDECECRIRLWRDARKAGFTDEWVATANKLVMLGKAAREALDYAMVVRTVAACQTAAAVGNKFFEAWGFVVAVIGHSPAADPVWSPKALDAAQTNFAGTLDAVGKAREARAAVQFLG